MTTNDITTLKSFSYEQLAHALYQKGEEDGYPKVTDKTKWRELVISDKLNHIPHTKISAGLGKDEYGSDAFDPVHDRFAEYKTMAIVDDKLRNLLQEEKSKGKKFAPLRVVGVYNGAYKQSALDAYSNVDHYFAVFHKEMCKLIIKVNTDEVIRQLTINNENRGQGKTTNLNSVEINLADTHLYTVAYQNYG